MSKNEIENSPDHCQIERSNKTDKRKLSIVILSVLLFSLLITVAYVSFNKFGKVSQDDKLASKDAFKFNERLLSSKHNKKHRNNNLLAGLGGNKQQGGGGIPNPLGLPGLGVKKNKKNKKQKKVAKKAKKSKKAKKNKKNKKAKKNKKNKKHKQKLAI